MRVLRHRTRLIVLVSFAAPALVLAIVLWPRPAPPVTLRFLAWAHGDRNGDGAERTFGPRVGSDFALAILSVENVSHRPTTYLCHSAPFLPEEYHLLFEQSGRWKPQPTPSESAMSPPHSCIERRTIAPSENTTLWVVVDSERPCRVGVTFMPPRGKILRLLPRWLSKGLRLDGSFLVVSDTINWRKKDESPMK